MATNKNKNLDLEKSMAELEKIVSELESGDLSLDKSLRQFEKGVRISRECQAVLNEAEQKVQLLMDGEAQDVTAERLSTLAE